MSRREIGKPIPDYKLFRCVMPGWDNEARKPGRGHAFVGATPSLYRTWLAAVSRATDKAHGNPGEKLVFINAWNEWAEGAYLEPDRRYGYAFLQATKEALLESGASAPAARRDPPLYVVVHAFYTDVFREILDYLKKLDRRFTLYVTCPIGRGGEMRTEFQRSQLQCPLEVVEVENRGRDVFAFLEIMRLRPPPEDAIIIKVHTKKSTHRSDGDNWRREMFDQLLSPNVVEQAVQAFARDPKLGLIAPAKHLAPITTYIGFNQARIENLLRRGGWPSLDLSNDVFAAGTMFFARRSSLTSVLALGLTRAEFEDEAGQRDGTMAHALERFFALAILREGGQVIDTSALTGKPAGGEFGFAVKTDHFYRPPT